MGALFDYLKQVERFTHDAHQRDLDPADLIDYINRARREIAGRTQSIRVTPTIQAGVATITVEKPGSGYAATDPLVISAPDSPSGGPAAPSGVQATGGITVDPITGAVLAVAVINGGAGYFQPTAAITSSTGSGAVLAAKTAGTSITAANQEEYRFADVDLSANPGVGAIIAVRSVSIIYANYRYVLPKYAWTTYQAFIRQYPRQYYYVPTMCSQFGQGAGGSLFLYPIASAPYQTEWDCTCLPQDLLTNNDVEALPLPWTDAVPYFAAHLAFAELQNLNASKFFLDLYDQMVHRYSAYARPAQITNVYGRW